MGSNKFIVAYGLDETLKYWSLARRSARTFGENWWGAERPTFAFVTDGPTPPAERARVERALPGETLLFVDMSKTVDEYDFRFEPHPVFRPVNAKKILIPLALAGLGAERVLVLDADTEAVGPVGGLATLDFAGHAMIAFADPGFSMADQSDRDRAFHCRKVVTDEADWEKITRVAGENARPIEANLPYVNSGMMLFDMNNLGNTAERTKLASELFRKYYFVFPEQDMINLCWDINRLDNSEYNAMPGFRDAPLGQARLIHCTGGMPEQRAKLEQDAAKLDFELFGPGKLFISVYAITKNEEKFVDRWMDSMKEADEIVVLDTGSTDGTVEKLRARGAKVEVREFKPWRFDTSRNASMELCSPEADILVCTDLDEVLNEGWRKQLEDAWLKALAEGLTPTTGTYQYIWNFTPDGKPDRTFTYEKVHAPNTCKWTHPVHEILSYNEGVRKVEVPVPGMVLKHYPDPTKSRGSYLPLLEMSVQEDPEDDRNMHYLGREYMFHGEWQKAIDTLKRHLRLPRARWYAERAASMRFIGRCYKSLNRPEEAELWYRRAVDEAPDQRESAVELAQFLYDGKAPWTQLLATCRRALSVTVRAGSYLTEAEAWGAKPHDLASLALWYTGHYDDAIAECKKAIEFEPGNERLKSNLKLMEDARK